MKQLSTYIQEKLIINKNYREVKIDDVKSFGELRQIIEYRYDKLGAGTERDPIDFNDIDVSNFDSFCNELDKGIFDGMNFKYIDISDWDVSNVTNMRCMFFDCGELKSVGDLSNWDVSNVTDMSSMFYECNELKFIGDISKWNVSKVTNMTYMFNYCKKFNQDLSCWNVSNVIYKDSIFDNCPIKEEYKPKFK